MIKTQLVALATLVTAVILPTTQSAVPLLSPIPQHLMVLGEQEVILAQQSMGLTDRIADPAGNRGFADNILLALHYLKGDVEADNIDWEQIRQPFEVSFTLEPGEFFAFHANTLPEFKDPKYTLNSRFFVDEGYLSVYGLGGNGVCHLSSLMTWVATEAGLEVTAPARHDFFPIPGIDRKYGTSIRSQQAGQNLYLVNGFEQPVTFIFEVDTDAVNLKVVH